MRVYDCKCYHVCYNTTECVNVVNISSITVCHQHLQYTACSYEVLCIAAVA